MFPTCQGGPDANCVDHGGDVVHADDPGAPVACSQGGSHGRRGALQDRPAGQGTEEALAGEADQDRTPQGGKSFKISQYLDIVRQRVAWGPGPRASQAFMLACRARAILQGRLAPSVDDVVALAGPILRHRMAVNFSARAEGITIETVIARMCARLA